MTTRTRCLSTLAVVLLAASCSRSGERLLEPEESGELNFIVDASVTPIHPELPGFDDGPPRPVAGLVDDEERQVDFVANELILSTGDEEVLAAFLARWDGELVLTVEPTAAGIPAAALHLIRIQTDAADPGQLVWGPTRARARRDGRLPDLE